MKAAVVSLRIERVLPLLMLLIAGGGCGAVPASIRSWQESVEDFIWEEANGDPNVLRELTWGSSQQRGFSIVGGSVPTKATDANGVLLAHRPVRGQQAFIFLVGLVRREMVEDIRLAILFSDEGRLRWLMSRANDQAVQAYRQSRGGAEPDGPVSFPSVLDTFEVSASEAVVSTRHDQSGAEWLLPLGEMPRRQSSLSSLSGSD